MNMDKLDKELQAFCTCDFSTEKFVEVLVSIDLPSPKIEVSKDKQGKRKISVLKDKTSDAEIEAKIDEAAMFLEGCLENPINWLSAASVFVTKASIAELAELSRSPLVKRISKNGQVKTQ